MSNYNRYMNNYEFFDKNGRRRPGVITDKMPKTLKRDDPAKEDRENREEVIRQIDEFMENGDSLEEACKKVAEKSKDKFKYFPEYFNRAEVFAGWWKGRHREIREVEKV